MGWGALPYLFEICAVLVKFGGKTLDGVSFFIFYWDKVQATGTSIYRPCFGGIVHLKVLDVLLGVYDTNRMHDFS